MKRDMDLVREILLEAYRYPGDCLPQLEIKDHPHEQVMYHVKLLIDAGLIEAVDASSSSRKHYLEISLTWDGQDFIEAAQNETIWKKAKSNVISTVGVLTVEALKIVLKQMMTSPFLG